MIRAAFDFSARAHSGQKRKSGEPYITHPVQVASTLASMGLDHETVAAGLLHDVIEDCGVTVEALQDRFGSTVSGLVEGVTKIGMYNLSRPDQQQILSFRKMILAMAEDLRVMLVKLSDRLHNMRTLASLDSESRKRIAEETLHIYAPIANRLGMWSVMAELEDLSFAELHPKASARIASDLERAKPRARAFIVRTRRKILKKLGGAGLGVTVQARMKHLYSIFSKMERKGYDLQRLHDIFAFRVVTQSEDECYRCLSLLHDAWKAAPGRVKDYISRPKPNGYQSLHTILLSEDNLPFEVQIRTQSMHRIAESGVAAHALYKTARSGLRDVQRELLWIQRLKELAQETDSMDAIRTSLREEEIFVLTPGRDIIALPRGATILDFAYRIHTDVGHRTSGALVHDRMVPLATELKTGDVVTILTHPKHRPSRDWLSMVVTASARGKIRKALQQEERKRAEETGQKIFERFVRLHGLDSRQILNSEPFLDALRHRGYSREVDLFIALGQERADLERILEPWLPAEESLTEELPPVTRIHEDNRVLVGGEDGLDVRYAGCCFPLPGDSIQAQVTRTRGIVIHRSSCASLRSDTLYPASWLPGRTGRFRARIMVQVEEPFLSSPDLTRECLAFGLGVSEIQRRLISPGRALLSFMLFVRHINDYLSLRGRLLQMKGVVDVSRAGEGKRNPTQRSF